MSRFSRPQRGSSTTDGCALVISGSGEEQAGERLARVSYLPGVTPLSAQVPQSDSVLHQESFQQAQSVQQPESPGERSARAHDVSMRALTRRGLSAAEMRTRLEASEIAPADVEFEVLRLEEVGLLDDHELARTLVRTLRERKGLGRSAITAELRRRRIDPVAIEQALFEADEEHGDDELTRAREIALKRAPQLRSLDPETARRRLGAFLMRKGYSGSIVSSAVASALASASPSTTAWPSKALGSKSHTSRGPRFQ